MKAQFFILAAILVTAILMLFAVLGTSYYRAELQEEIFHSQRDAQHFNTLKEGTIEAVENSLEKNSSGSELEEDLQRYRNFSRSRMRERGYELQLSFSNISQSSGLISVNMTLSWGKENYSDSYKISAFALRP